LTPSACIGNIEARRSRKAIEQCIVKMGGEE
jgi:hypothetical protein